MHTLATVTLSACVLVSPAAPDEATPAGKGLRLQPGDDIAKPINPIRERGAKGEREIDALARFSMGRLHESRGEFRKALADYRRALEWDPGQVAIYRRLVPLEFSLGENEQGIEHALTLVELAPDDVDLMRKLSQVLISRGRIARATGLLEQALKVETVDRFSAQFLTLKRDLGVLYLAAGDGEKAAAAFEVLLEGLQNPAKYQLTDRQRQALLPDPEKTYEQLGQAFLAADETDLAVQAFTLAAKARPDKPGILEYDLARTYLAADKPEKALSHINTYIEQGHTERGRAAYDVLKSILTKLERGDRFQPRLREIIEKQSDNHPARLVLADELLTADKIEEAAALYEAVIAESPEAGALLGMARIDRRRGEADEILEWLSRAKVAGAGEAVVDEELTELAARESLTKRILAAARAEAEKTPPETDFASALLAGKLAVKAERLDDADYLFHLAARLRPDKKGSLLGELGLALMGAEKLPEAIDVLGEALDATANDAQRLNLMLRLAQAQEFHHKTEAALNTIEEALRIAPDVPLLHFQRGWIHFHAGHDDRAERIFQEVIEKYPQDADILRQTRLTLSALYVQQGKIERGEEVLEAIYAEEPDNPAVCNDLGYLYADQGKKLDQAETMIRKAVEAEPENAAYLDSLGWVLHKQGRDKQAATHLEKAVELPQGDDATIWDHLGDVYDKLGRSQKAKEAWRHALQLAREAEMPDEELVQRIEAKLK